jgi:DNA-binding beta-propeller fold protein YncE
MFLISKVNTGVTSPAGICFDTKGNLYIIQNIISDPNITIIKVDGTITTLNCRAHNSIAVDFNENIYFGAKYSIIQIKLAIGEDKRIPTKGESWGITVDKNGTVYYVDDHYVNKILPNWEVYRIAGDTTSGFIDGPIDNARFCYPTGIAVSIDGTIMIADHGNKAIRKIHNGIVSTVMKCDQPVNITVDSIGNYYFTTIAHKVYKISSNGEIVILIDQLIKSPYGIAIQNNIMYITSEVYNEVYKVLLGHWTTGILD